MDRLPSLKTVGRNTVVLLTLLGGACGEDGAPPAPVDTVSRDAGRGSKDAGKDAGKARDAGAKGDDDEPTDEADDDTAGEDAVEDDGDEDDTGAMAEPSAKPDAGAAKDAGKPASDAGAPTTPGEMADCSALTYESFGKKFIATYCIECHSGSSASSALGGVSLDSLANVVKNKAYLKKVTAPRPGGIEPRMPKGGNDALTDEERLKFGAWVDCGPK
jgi:hypothetical protein